MRKIYTLLLALIVSAIAFAQETYSITFNIDHPERVKFTSYYATIPDPLTEVTVINYTFDYGTITVNKAGDDYFIKSIVDENGTAVEPSYGSYYINTNSSNSGKTYTITTGDIKTEPKATCYVTVDQPENVRFSTALKRYEYIPLEAAPAVNEVKFVEGLESPFFLLAASNEYNTILYKVMVDGEEIFPNSSNNYSVAPTDGSRVEITYAFPEDEYTLTIEIPEGFDIDNVVESLTAYREYESAPLEVSSSVAVPAGNKVSLAFNPSFNAKTYSINGADPITVGHGQNSIEFFVTKDSKIVLDGQEYKIYDVTINVNHASCVNAINFVSYSEEYPIELVDGSNPLKISEGRPTIYLYPTNAGVINSVTDEKGNAYTPSYWDGNYSITISDDGPSEINIDTEVFSSDPVKVTLANDEFKFSDVIREVRNSMDPSVVVEVDENGFTAYPGQYYIFTFNEDDYTFDQYDCYYLDDNNTTSYLFQYSSPCEFQVIKGGSIYLNATINPIFKFSITIDNPELVEVFRGEIWYDDKITGFEAGVAKNFEWKASGQPKVSLRLPQGYYAQVYEATNDIYLKYSGGFYVDNEYDIRISAAEFDRSTPITFFIKDLSTVDDENVYLRTQDDTYIMYNYGENKFVEGYNTAYIDPIGDSPLMFRINGYATFSKDNAYVYLNEQLVPNDYLSYYGETFEASLTLKEGDVVKAFCNEPDGEPALHDIAFEIEGDKNFTVKKDLNRNLEDLSAVKAHAGTQFDIIPNEGAEIEVSLNGAPVELAEGAHTFTVDGPASVKIVGEQSAIGNISADAAAIDTDVYNLQGIKVLSNATEDQIKALPAGLYIQGGKKIVVK